MAPRNSRRIKRLSRLECQTSNRHPVRGQLRGHPLKVCTVCKQEKALSEFYNRVASDDGKAYRCKSCDTLAGQEYRARHYVRQRRNGLRALTKWKYGLTLEERDALFEQGCEICGDTKTQMAVDHDHDKPIGTYRGVLCVRCNAGIGNFRENIGRMESAIQYLRKHGRTQ